MPLLSCGSETWRLRKAVCAGFFAHASKRDTKDQYKTIADEQTAFIHPSSALFNKFPEYLVYNELVFTVREYMRDVAVIDPRWLVDVAPNFYRLA